jgi:DinB superfamily
MNPNTLLISTVLQSWRLIIDRTSKTLSSFTDDELQLEVAPGKNRLYYLVGHLAAIHDRLFPLLRLGKRLHPELDSQFVDSPDRKLMGDGVSPAQLRTVWVEVNTKLTDAFETLQPQEWLQRHDSVSEEDFAKDPLRNRLAVLISRVNHAAYHEGQMRLAR